MYVSGYNLINGMGWDGMGRDRVKNAYISFCKNGKGNLNTTHDERTNERTDPDKDKMK